MLGILIPVALACIATASPSLSDRFSGNMHLGDRHFTGERMSRSPRQFLLMQVADRDGGNLLTTEIDVTDAFGEPGKPLALQIELPAATVNGPFSLSITGIPPQFDVSRGIRSEADWLFTMKELNGLTITAPVSFAGRFTIGVKLLGVDQKVLAAGSAFVTIREQSNAAPRSAADVAQPAQVPKPQPVAPRSSSMTPSDEAAQLERADALLKSGDISAARLILETLSDEGSGKAAYSLGLTYDPVFFSSNFIRGMAPEPATAAIWYQKAFELGYKEAGSAISRLQANK
jgi:hypothetical protein